MTINNYRCRFISYTNYKKKLNANRWRFASAAFSLNLFEAWITYVTSILCLPLGKVSWTLAATTSLKSRLYGQLAHKNIILN